MDIDSPPSDHNLLPLSPQDRIVSRLVKGGVPEEKLDQLHRGLVSFAKENKAVLLQLVSAILPSDEEVSEILQAVELGGSVRGPSLKDHYKESIAWLQWLMFEEDPHNSLTNLAKLGVSQRGVCGAVWGKKDIAYRCRTCEHDPTCAICVSCFQNGNHKDHDYSIIYTGGGCCDCGDVTAWKREGFCSKHKGAEQIQPLPEEIANSVEPVLDALLVYWRDTLFATESTIRGSPRESNHTNLQGEAANTLSSVVVEMLLNFCNYSESLLAFVSRRMLPSVGLLDVLARSERFLRKKVVKKLHELLLKLLGEPIFKYAFAKAFINYYPTIVNETIKEGKDSAFETYQLLSTFSVQIFTVPTLTPRLVRELNLLDMLLGCLADLFRSCVGEGSLQVNKWADFYETTIRLLEDIRYVMSHVEVRKYVVHELSDISRTWAELLTIVQGMDPQKRVTGLHVEDENDNMHMPFVLGHFLGNIHSLLAAGAFAVDDPDEMTGSTFSCMDIQDLDDSDKRHAKVGRLSQESSVCSTTCRTSWLDRSQLSDTGADAGKCPPVPYSVSRLIFECLRAIESWLRLDTAQGRLRNSSSPFSKTSTQKKTLLKIKRGRSNMRSSDTYTTGGRVATSSGFYWKLEFDSSSVNANLESEVSAELAQSDDSIDTEDMDSASMEAACAMELDGLGLLSTKDWQELRYDVSSEDISFHIPLHRFLSLLLQKALERSYKESGLTSAISGVPLSGQFHDFFGQVLEGCHPHGFSAFVMEHPLQLRVFCAQVHAGMWRKNGEVAVSSCEWYRSVRWWEQGLEFDLFLLQCCAALAPPDLFVKRIQERFGLSNYHSLSLERPNEYEPVLVQEMLTLIIQIVKERRFCGLSTAENLRRELVYKLAVGEATHSQLVKALPNGLSKSDELQKTVDSLAVYSNPSGIKQGKYSLRKAYWKELDLYHPRWNSRDLQIAEERYLRFCKVSALTVQLPRWTKIFYPLNAISRIATCKEVLQIIRTVLFYAVFSDRSSASRSPDGVLLTSLHLLSLALDICSIDHSSANACDREDSFPILTYASEEIYVGVVSVANAWKRQSMLSLLVALMRKYRKETEHSLVEASQCDFASLIENLLKKLVELNSGCMAELQRLAPDVVGSLLQHPSSSSIQSPVSASGAAERKAKARERQAAILEKMRTEQAKFIASVNSTPNSESDLSQSEVSIAGDDHVSEEAASVVCCLCRDPDSRSPLSFLVLLQKSRLTSFLERGPPSWDEVHSSDKDYFSIISNEMTDPSGNSALSTGPETIPSAHLVELVQNTMNVLMHYGQPTDADAVLDFIKARLPAIRNIQLPNASYDTCMDIVSSPETTEEDIYRSIQRAIHGTILHSKDDWKHPISCDEAFAENRSNKCAVLGEYIASLSREALRQPPASGSGPVHGGNVSSKSTIRHLPFDGFGPTDCDGIHVSSCGHAVHQECRDRYLSSLRQRFIRRIVFEGGHVVDPDQGELLCPVCRRLANSVLPSLPQESRNLGKQLILLDDSSSSMTGSSSTIDSDNHALYLPLSVCLLRSSANVVGKSRFGKTSSLLKGSTRAFLDPIFHALCNMYYPERYDSLLASGRASQSLILWDTLRYSLISTEIAARDGKSRTSSGGLKSLYKGVESSSGFLLSLLLQVSQATRGQNSLQVLLRFRGLQLFSGSICSGVSVDESFTGGQGGSIVSILKLIDNGANFPDIQFWRRAADPILAHDPFSSLMWVLFCLPIPFLSSMESFISLVHLFYVVCVIQALIACLLNRQFDISELQIDDHVIQEIHKIMGESVVAWQFFVSKYIDSSCHPKDMIRRFTHPYLRRCALLWKLLKSSTAVPFSAGAHGLESSSPQLSLAALEGANRLSVELKEISELEHLFHILSLELVLKDEAVHALALKWCVHFSEEFRVRNYGHLLPSAPAAPFKLMHLPQLYQDLLQRYIKQQCPECKNVPDEPALCLLCGRLCSPSWKSCCRENGCQSHAMACGAGIGVFLLIRRTTILLQRSARQAPWPSLYLDMFGEEDIDMHRGKPLYLNEERYAALTHMVASHGLDQSSEVLRQTTIDMLFTV
eukprot:TRINITY_DN1573_c1_g1_i1.p1 TRINITY_DN1573_c1_g1~~TRINITY_DN1573_c1_g1_i1.p1  ORF type:complete len:2067 (+),score=416.93 TRINITY_DN1573_c1_g1_i1:302-6502(+)